MFFKDIAGQHNVKQKLIQNSLNGRVSHAQLFLGPEGSGKLAMAVAYARFLACSNPSPSDACGKCRSCLMYSKLAHPDLNFFFPNPSKSSGGKTFMSSDYLDYWRTFLSGSPYGSLNSWYKHVEIENKQGIINTADCNEIVRVLSYKAYESKFKVVIIWMIERLYHAAAPKLLKILEEPPPNTLFLLISENQEQILPTILSRTQIVKVPKLSDDEVREALILLNHCQPKQAEDIAFLADGNFYRAQTMLKDDEVSNNDTTFLRSWLRNCYSFKIADIINDVEEFAKRGRESQKAMVSFAIEIFRQCNLVNYQAVELLKTHSEAKDFIFKFATVLPPDVALLMVEEFSQSMYHIERNANPKILFTDLSLKVAQIFNQSKK